MGPRMAWAPMSGVRIHGVRIRIDRLEQPAAHARLHADETASSPGVAELDPAQPPSIDLASENLERQGRCDGDADADPGRIAGQELAGQDLDLRLRCTVSA